ncbi:MAG: hypothetical protein COA45_04180 [Zetaproteobacteria bacterium]|nr:MAG: hypothetical protein COA45_04180 [Zetaproteobacteria bacterium]
MPNFLTVKQLAAKHPAFSESSLRYHLFHKDTNNLAQHVRKIGAKILIDEHGFVDWINANGGE